MMLQNYKYDNKNPVLLLTFLECNKESSEWIGA